MPLADLSVEEREIVRDCLRASVEGPFFPDWEFATLFGLKREEVNGILSAWPDLDDKEDASVACAINSAFNNLLGYPHHRHDIWPQYIPVEPKQLAGIYFKWKGRAVKNYFDGWGDPAFPE